MPAAEHSFTRSLFFGSIEEGFVFPWPDVAPTEIDAIHPLLDRLRRFFDTRVDSAEIDRQETLPADVLEGLRGLGCFGLLVPKAHGGLGLGVTGYARVLQE